MDKRKSLEQEASDSQRAMVIVVYSLIFVAAITMLEIKISPWPLGIAGGISVLIGGIAVAAIPKRLPNRIWAYFIWLFLVVPIWLPTAAHLTCDWRQLCP